MEKYVEIIAQVIPAVFAITVHEVAHGWVANRCGDSTAAREGRLTLNPLKHVDPIGTVLVPLILLLTSSFFFGWAKPVPVNSSALQNPRRDMALVAAAGPVANLLMLLGWLAGYHLLKYNGVYGGLLLMCWAGIMFNAIIMLLNLIPLPPLDGSRIVRSLLPAKAASLYGRIEPYGLLIVAVLLFTNVLGTLLDPIPGWVSQLL
jgi:Zn-dependent protease